VLIIAQVENSDFLRERIVDKVPDFAGACPFASLHRRAYGVIPNMDYLDAERLGEVIVLVDVGLTRLHFLTRVV
jgi:hypothetical protein